MAVSKGKANVLDLLLNADETKIQKPTKELEIKRLSEALGEKVIFLCEAVSTEKMDEIQQNAIHIKGKDDFDIDMSEVQVFTVIEGVKEPNFKSKELRDKFKAPTPKELVKKLLLPGEVAKIYGVISDLSGFGDKAVEEVKN